MKQRLSAQWMKKAEPYFGLAILVFIIVAVVFLIRFVHLQEEVKATCGYQPTEKIYCECSKDFVSTHLGVNNPYYINPGNFSNKTIIPSG